MLKFHNVSRGLGKFKLENITFELPEGYIMGLIGENGAGKTSILKMMLGLLEVQEGEVLLFGKSYEQAEREIKEELGYVLVQDLFGDGISLQENANMYGKYYKNYREEKLLDYCNRFSLDVKKKHRELSKGEKLKFQFAFALAHAPKLLILDEPTANFDPEFREQFLHILTDFVSDGCHSVILASHLMSDLDRIADYITFVHKGKLLFSLDRETLQERYRMVKGEDYKINLLPKERVVYKEKREFGSSALVRHRRIDVYDKETLVSIPTLEEIMYFILKGQEQEAKKGGWHSVKKYHNGLS